MEFRSDPGKSFPCKSVSNTIRHREDLCRKTWVEAGGGWEREREGERIFSRKGWKTYRGRWIELFDGSARKWFAALSFHLRNLVWTFKSTHHLTVVSAAANDEASGCNERWFDEYLEASVLYSTEDFYRSSITSAVSARRFRDGTHIWNVIKVARHKKIFRRREYKNKLKKNLNFQLYLLIESIISWGEFLTAY